MDFQYKNNPPYDVTMPNRTNRTLEGFALHSINIPWLEQWESEVPVV